MMVLWLEVEAASPLTERRAGVASLSALALGTTSESVGILVARALVVATVAVS